MGLIDLTRVTPTLEQIVSDIKRTNFNMYNNLIVGHTDAFNMVWSNPHYTPKEIIGAFGADAIPLFQLSSGIQQLLATADPTYIPLVPTKTVDIDPNTGIVTIGD
jgi:hypothetical protein